MTVLHGDYATLLNEKRIQYMPSCVIVEMMTRLYSQVSVINLTGDLHTVAPDILILLKRLSGNINITAESFRESRINFFIGDWKDDKLRARKLFFNIMSRLGYICELLGDIERSMLYEAVEELTAEWDGLDRIMEAQSAAQKGCISSCHTCRYFRSEHPDNWKQIMANIILSLDASSDPEDGSFLILLCYERLKAQLIRSIAEAERKSGSGVRFNPDRILTVSNEDISISCPRCTLMTDSLRGGDTGIIRREYESPALPRSQTVQRKAAAKKNATSRISLKKSTDTKVNAVTRRYVMPPSLSGVTGSWRR